MFITLDVIRNNTTVSQYFNINHIIMFYKIDYGNNSAYYRIKVTGFTDYISITENSFNKLIKLSK